MKFFDFHTHPYILQTESIKRYKKDETDGYAAQRKKLENIGIYRAAGSVISGRTDDEHERFLIENETVMQIFDAHPDFFVPGLRINPAFTAESCALLENAYKKGVRLVGELTPLSTGNWAYADCKEIFTLCGELGMTVSCHPTQDADMESICRDYPKVNFVFAHPGEYDSVELHIKRMKKYENAYLDISGTGLFRFGMLRYLIDRVGADRILFGTDYPICNAGMYTNGVLFETLTDRELEKIAYQNAERLLFG